MPNSDPPPRTQIPIVCPGHTRPLAELQFVQLENEEHNRSLLWSACHDKIPMLRDGVTGDWIGSLVGHKGAVWACHMDPAGNICATASGDFSVRVWDAITGACLCELKHQHIVKTCAISKDNALATGGKDKDLRIYDLEACLLRKERQPKWIQKQGAAITKLTWLTGEASGLLCACANGQVYWWKDLELAHIFDTGSKEEIRDMEVRTTESGTRVLTVAAGSLVYFWNVDSHQLLHKHKMPIHFREEGGASLHPSGTKFVAGGSDLWIRVFDFETGQQLECHKGHHGPIRCVRYSTDGSLYATGSEDGTIRLWKTDIPASD